MTSKAVTWVHGTAVAVEFPKRYYLRAGICRDPKGWGTFFWAQENTDNWFHFPFQTPLTVTKLGPKLAQIFVLYETYGWAAVHDVHVWDGRKLIKEVDELNLSGDHLDGIDTSNSWLVDPPTELRFGLGISVKVQFGAKTRDKDREIVPGILFVAVGAEFDQP
jgi:hypothetical protein